MSVFISLFTIALNAILAENFILVKFMGICPFMGVSKKQDTALGMGIAVTFVMGIASAATWAVNEFLLVPLNLVYMQTVVFILVIAALVQLVEMFLQKAVPALYQALGIYLPLIVVNCIILGRAEMFACKNTVADSALDGLGMGIGYILTMLRMSSIREIIGSGTWMGITIIPESVDRMTVMNSAPGGFFVFGCMIALVNKITKGKAITKKEFGCAACPGCGKVGSCSGKEEAAK